MNKEGDIMRLHRRSRIVATLGPASSSLETIRALAIAGADVFRLNFSHGTHADHQERYNRIREVERELGRPIGVLLDLQGPKLRIGTLASGKVLLKKGTSFDWILIQRPDVRSAPIYPIQKFFPL